MEKHGGYALDTLASYNLVPAVQHLAGTFFPFFQALQRERLRGVGGDVAEGASAEVMFLLVRAVAHPQGHDESEPRLTASAVVYL